MSKLSIEQPILRCLQGETLDTPPIWFMRQAGRHLPEYLEVRDTAKNFIDFCFSPKKAAEVTLQPIRRYGMDGAILFADILLIPIGLGRNVTFKKGIGPVLDPLSVQDISKLTPKGAADRISSVYETVERVRSELANNKTLIGFCGAPWTVATYMIEGRGSPDKEIAKRFAYNHPEAMDDLLEILASSSADYLIGQAKAGANVLKIFESWAQGLSPNLFEKCVIRPTVIMINKIREAGINIPIICFPRAAGLNFKSFIDKIDCQGIALGTDTELSFARDIVGDKICLQGNLDPLALRIGGDVLKAEVERIMSGIKGPHIFNLGHGVTPDVKIDNIHAVISHIRSGHGNYI